MDAETYFARPVNSLIIFICTFVNDQKDIGSFTDTSIE